MSWILAAPWILVFLFVILRFRRAAPQLASYAPQSSGPPLSVVIPARNEALNVEACMRSILAARYAPLEVILVDDGSTDGTAEIAERVASSVEAGGRARLVRGAALPTGWFGKPWAIVQGYHAATGELLLFADADTRHEPELIPRAVRALAQERVDLVSVIPRQEMVTFWERLVQPHVFLALQARVGDLRRVNRTRTDWNAIANGQFILTTRAAYERVGSHEAVKHFVAEDVALAQIYVRHHLDIFLTHGTQYMTTRMYRSLAAIVEGWSKNLALGAPLMFPPIRVVRRAAPYLIWLPALAWIVPPVWWAVTGAHWAALATLASLATWVAVYRIAAAPVRYALLYPLGAVMVAYIMIRSAWRGARKVEWRGRLYSRR